MPDNKLTDVTDNNVGKMNDNEIIKALECCRDCCCKQCENEPNFQSALDLINRVQTKVIKEQNKNSKLRNERNHLQAQIDEMFDTLDYRAKKILELEDNLKTAEAENEELNTFAEIKKEEIVKIIARAKAEAYKEFDELLKDECLSYPLGKDDITMLVDVERYNNLLKELKEKIGE